MARRSTNAAPRRPKPDSRPAEGPRASWVLAALVLVAYANALSTGFPLDNAARVLADPRVQELSIKNLGGILTEEYWWPITISGLYRPLTTLTLLLNYVLPGGGSNPAGYHVVNLALHWLVALLAFRVGRALDIPHAFALAAAALLAIHPAGTETVTNIIGRSDLLATASVLGCLVLYLQTAGDPTPARSRLVLFTAMAAGGLLSKESAVVLAPILLVHALLEGGRPWGVAMLRARPPRVYLGACLVALAVVGALRWLAVGDDPAPEIVVWDNPLVAVSGPVRALAAVGVVGRYLALFVWPVRLCCDYSYEIRPEAVLTGYHALALAFLALTVGLVFSATQRSRRVAFGLAFFFVALLPVSNLLIPIGSPMAERFLYMPMVGLCLATVETARLVQERLAMDGPIDARLVTLGKAVASILVLALIARTALRNLDWKSDETLWTAAARDCPGSLRAHLWLVDDLRKKGAEPDLVLGHARRADGISGGTPLARIKLGASLRRKADRLAAQGDAAAADVYREAVATLQPVLPFDRAQREKILARQPRGATPPPAGNPELYENVGLAALALGDVARAREAFEYFRSLEPTATGGYLRLSDLAVLQGQPDAAAVALFQALLLERNLEEAQRKLVELYRASPQGCELSQGEHGPRLNIGCPRVKDHLCRAYGELPRTLGPAAAPGLLQGLSLGAQQSGCGP
jgi:protein O-mannosyl-transferase